MKRTKLESKPRNIKLLLGILLFHLLIIGFSIVDITTNIQRVGAENVLTDSGTLNDPGDSYTFSFSIPENVESYTITLNGDPGTDFDVANIYNYDLNNGYFFESVNRDIESEVFTLNYPEAGNWTFDVVFSFDSLGIGGNFSVYVDYTLLPSDPQNTFFTAVGQLDSYGYFDTQFTIPVQATGFTVELTGDDIADYDISNLCDRYIQENCTSQSTPGSSTETITIEDAKFQEWDLSIFSLNGGGRYRVRVFYESVDPAPGSEIYSVTGTAEPLVSSYAHNFDLYDNVDNLYVSLIIQDANVFSLDLSVEPPNSGVRGDYTESAFYKSVGISSPDTGTYTVRIFPRIDLLNSVDYEIKVFTQNYDEYSELTVEPIVNNTASSYSADITTADLNINVDSGDNLVLLFASYRSTGWGLWDDYISYVGTPDQYDAFTRYNESSCYSRLLENVTTDMETQIWYLSNPPAGLLDIDFTYQMNGANIRDVQLTAMTISNANSDGLIFNGTTCEHSGNANRGGFSLVTKASESDLVVGTFFTNQNVSITSGNQYIYGDSRSNSSVYTVSDTVASLNWSTVANVSNYVSAAVAIRAQGPILSPYSTTTIPGGTPVEDLENPVLSITTEASNPVVWSNPVFEGTITDDVGVDYATYSSTYNYGNIENIDLSGSSRNKTFSFSVPYLSPGIHSVTITAYDTSGKSVSETFNFELFEDYDYPFCDLPSQNSVVYNSTVTYSNVPCTDDSGIQEVLLTVYRDNLFTEVYSGLLPESATADNSFGGTEETLTFTLPESLPDGIIFVRITPKDLAGKDAQFRGSDFFTLEAADNTAPTLNLEPIRPDPIVDTTPGVTGSCSDNSLYDTNSVIASLRYRLDGGAWQNITPLDGGFGNIIERYSFELPEVDTSLHTVEVECTDTAGLVSTKSDEFSIIEPVPVDPQIVVQTETFNDHTNHALSESNLIWGNGRLRLRESITTSRTSIDTTNYPTKYINTAYNRYLVTKDPADNNRIWYSRTGEIVSYNIQTNQSTLLNPASWGLTNLSSPIQMIRPAVYNGKSYLWVSDYYRLQVYNLTDNVAMERSIFATGDIFPDSSRGRLGAYIIENGLLGYLNLNNTLTNTSDDTLTFVPTETIPYGIMEIYYDSLNGDFYLNRYGEGLYKFNDNNTPTNFSDDQVGLYTNSQFENNGNVFSMFVDPNGYLFVGMAGYNQTGGLYLVVSDNNTPYNTLDDDIIRLADSTEIKNLNIYDIQFIEGRDNVGNQLFLGGELGDAYYLNFNNTYTDLLDDTYIRLTITTNNRGVDTAGAYRGSASFAIHDYNTLYVNGDLDGFQRYTLNRGWVDSGQAVIYSTPEDRLVANYFELRDVDQENNINLAYTEANPNIFERLSRFIFPAVNADPIPVAYSVSIDDGVTWSPITLTEILSFNQNDYRVKFRIEMNEATPGASPVIDSYTLAFGAYQDQDQSQTLGLSINAVPNNVQTSESFGVEVKVVDDLGFTNTDFNGLVNLTLVNASTLADVTNLLNITSANLVNGEASLNNVRISQPGSYIIRGIYNATAYSSNTITVSNAPVNPVPVMNFAADRYTIIQGQSVLLTWDTENLTSLSINRGIGTLNTLDGSLSVNPLTTTVYTLTGTGPYGNLERSLTITVNEPTPTVVNPPVVNPPAAPVSNDNDNDGLTNDEELSLGTNPNDSDTDNDGLLDGEEVDGCLYQSGTTTCSDVTFNNTNPNNANTDGDGLLDGEEVKGCYYDLNTVVCSIVTFTPTDPTNPNSPATVPVAVVNEPSEQGQTGNEEQTQQPIVNLTEAISTIANAVEEGANSGLISTALVATTTATTVATAATYPNLIAYALLWFRKRKKKSTWGLVYNRTNYSPVPFVTVRVLDSNNNFIAEEITDLNGKYSILVKPGTYTLQTKINDFEDYEQSISVEEERITLDIPIMPFKSQKNLKIEIRNWLKKYLPKINTFIFFIGFIVSLISTLISFNVFNLIVLILFGIQIAVYYLNKRDKTGKVFDIVTKKRLSGVFVRVYEEESGRQIGSAISDSRGRYNMFLNPGKYLVKFESLQYQMDPSVSKLKDALGNSYVEVEIKKQRLLDLQIAMIQKTNTEVSSNKFGFMG